MIPTTDIAAIGVASIAAAGAIASQRAAAKASKAGSRLDAEKEAYLRARAFDVETIERQDKELKELRTELAAMKLRLQALEGNTPIARLGLEGMANDQKQQDL